METSLSRLPWKSSEGHGMHLCEMCCSPVAQLSISAHFNMPKKMFCRLSPFLYHFIKMMSNKMTNVYFHGPSRLRCCSGNLLFRGRTREGLNVHSLPYIIHPQWLLGFLDSLKSTFIASSISRKHPGNFIFPQYSRSVSIGIELWQVQEHKDTRSHKNAYLEMAQK